MRIDYTNKDYTALREALLELAGERMPAWTDHSSSDLGVVLLELFAAMGDMVLHYQDRIANESFLETAVERRSVINLLRLIGYELRPPQPASADLTLLFKPDAAGTVTIEPGTELTTEAKVTGETISFQYVRPPLTIDCARQPLVEHEDGGLYRRYERLPVIQVDAAIQGEILGSSDGAPGQRFMLARAPVIDSCLEIEVDEGAGPVSWEQRSSLLNSGPDDRHYVVRRDENDRVWIELGDGKYGKIPRRGYNNVSAGYRIGGGAKGNVAAGTITKHSGIEDLELVFNPEAATGGSDWEPLAEAVQRGPKLFRSGSRAVTAADYEEHARRFGVGKVRARAGGWNLVELYVAPAGGGYPSETLKQDLLTYLEDKRMLTTALDILDPVYISVYVEGKLGVEAHYFTAQVRQQVEKAVSELFAFDQVSFEETIYLSKIYERIEAIEGVAWVSIDGLSRSEPQPTIPEDGKLCFGWSEIPVAGHSSTGILLSRVEGGRDAG
jgi:hypothetical protein